MNDRSKSTTASGSRPGTVFERTYRARVEELWDLWTTKEGFESWWGPDGFRAEVQMIEPRLGGMLNYEMIAATPEMVETMRQMGRPASHETRGRFSEIKKHERLTLTHIIDFLPGATPYENSISVEFVALGESVKMVVTFEPMHDQEFTKMSIMGFASQLTKLDRRFGTENR